jgi:hypothetical protein
MDILTRIQSAWRGQTTRMKIGLAILCLTAVIFIKGKDISSSAMTYSIYASDFDRAVKLISDLHSKSPSLRGLKYRSMICTIVRNDPHLVEFLLRHLIIGFSHIVLYDNNRILAGYDANITEVLEPFVAAGFVTHIPWHQNTTQLLENGLKNGNSGSCIDAYGRKADWVAILDTDEAFYFEKDNLAVHKLNTLLLDMEKDNLCGGITIWSFMYGEAEMLMRNSTLLEAYPRFCAYHNLGKILARPDQRSFNIPHSIHCTAKHLGQRTWTWSPSWRVALIHYYSKSMEEFLVKADQSVPPYVRKPIDSYDRGPTCELTRFNYSDDYRRTFLDAYHRLAKLHSVKPVKLRPPPSLNVKQTPDYPLFIHLKYRCAQRYQFDNEKYLSIYPEAKAAVEKGAVVDGLYHFMLNFMSGIKGCWKNSNDSFCE